MTSLEANATVVNFAMNHLESPKTFYFICNSCGGFVADGEDAPKPAYQCKSCGRIWLDLENCVKGYD